MKHMSALMNTVTLKSVVAALLLVVAAGVATAQSLIPQPVEMSGTGAVTRLRHIDAKIVATMSLPDEGYTLVTKKGKAVIRAKDRRGLVWARQTLRQLTDEDGNVPVVSIKDYPAFPLRGFMNDTGRNYRPVDMIKSDIDLMSFYKLNVFHWHLTDNPAWRIECRVYPQLNDSTYQQPGRDRGKIYTYAEIRDVIAYAKERGVMVLPEIDMPGHSAYFDRTFGFGMATEQGMKVLEACLEEFFEEIPAELCPVIHIGSDEVRVANPEGFIRFCESVAARHGREVMAWDPGLPGSEDVIAQVWRDISHDAVEKDRLNRYVDSYMGYLNKSNPFSNVYHNYLHQPCSTDSPASERDAKGRQKALGGILCLWNDVRVADQTRLFPHNGMPMTLLPFAERFWRGSHGLKVANEHLPPAPGEPAYAPLCEFERRMSCHRDRFLCAYKPRWVATLVQHWQLTLPEARGTQRADMRWVDTWGGLVDIMETARQHGVEIKPTMDAWMRAVVTAERDTVITAWVGFETAPRSSRISDGIGYQGQWESQGRLFVNGNEVFPPGPWQQPDHYRYFHQTWHQAPNELPYTDEQFFWMRTPAKVSLKAGRNEILMYCPRVFPNESWTAAFVPVHIDADGNVCEYGCIKFE